LAKDRGRSAERVQDVRDGVLDGQHHLAVELDPLAVVQEVPIGRATNCITGDSM